MKKLFQVLCGIFLSASLVTSVTGTINAAPYKSYNYVNGNNGITDVAAPTAYLPVRVLDENNLGVKLSAPEDLCQDDEGNFYVLDSATGYVHSFTSNWEKRYTLFGYLEAGNQNPTDLKKPQGICVWNNILYVAETEGNQIVKYDINTKEVIGFLKQPKSDLLGDGFEFRPKKIEVDSTGRIFVVAENVNQGLMELTQEGAFVGFVGSNSVVASPFEVIFRYFLTEEQIANRVAFVPVEYTNISLDPSGFIYAVTAVSEVNTPIRKLNPAGKDILVRNPVNGVDAVAGDLLYDKSSAAADRGPSSFVDIAANDQGIYFALDNNRGRIFAYDEDGNMLFEFGGNNTYQTGTFIQPSALGIVGNRIYVLDRDRKNIVAFEPTEYGQAIMDATRSYVEGNYEKSLVQWEGLLRKNCNFDLAYVKAGFCLYRMGDNEKAMEYFELANAREYYTKAFVKYRKDWLNENFTWLILGAIMILILLIVVIWWIRKWKNHRKEFGSGTERRGVGG